MKKHVQVAALVLLAGILVAASGCRSRPKPVRFNNTIARNLQQLSTSGKAFGKTIDAFVNKGEAYDIAKVRGAQRNAVEVETKLREEASAMKTSTTAEGMAWAVLNKYKAFLEGQKTIAEQHMPAIIAILENNDLDGGSKQTQVKNVLTTITQLEAPLTSELKSAQEDYFKAAKLKLGS